MTIGANDIPTYIFYALLLVATGAGEYLHLLPSGSMLAMLGLVTGHFFGNTVTSTSLKNIASDVSGVSTGVNEVKTAIVASSMVPNPVTTMSPTTPGDKVGP